MLRNSVVAVVAAFSLLLVSGCLTSPEPFFQEKDIVVDDKILGDYFDPNDSEKTHFYVSYVDQYYLKGHYYVTIGSKPSCQTRFHSVLFQVGTNRFLDMLPENEACDRVAASPPGIIEILQSLTIQPLHMVIKVEVKTNGLTMAFADYQQLVATAKKFPEYFQPPNPKPVENRRDREQFPRMKADMKLQREFLMRFGGDTNVFRTANLKKAAE